MVAITPDCQASFFSNRGPILPTNLNIQPDRG